MFRYFLIYTLILIRKPRAWRNSSAEIVRELRIDRPYIEIVTLDALLFCGHNVNIIFRGIQGSKTYFGKKERSKIYSAALQI